MVQIGQIGQVSQSSQARQIEINTKYLFDCIKDYKNCLDDKKTNQNKKRLGKIICFEKSFDSKKINENGDTILGSILIKIFNPNIENFILSYILELIQTNMFNLEHKNNSGKSIFDIIFDIVTSKLNINMIDKIIAKILSIQKSNYKKMDNIIKTFKFDLPFDNSNLLMFLIQYNLKKSVESLIKYTDYDLGYQNSQGYTPLRCGLKII